MPNYSGVWDLKEQGVAVKGDRWQIPPLTGNIGIFGGGYTTGFGTNTMTYITITSTGNATDFGDLTVGTKNAASASSSTRAIIMGGARTGTNRSVTTDYVTIASAGNASDFGDLTNAEENGVSCASNAHGGLQ